jgi:hypothetical protein
LTAIYHPQPINQFNRLVYDPNVLAAHTKGTAWNDVIAGHDFDSENCMASEGAVALDAHTGGAIRTSPTVIRQYGGDYSGGMGVDDVDKAWNDHFNRDLLTPADYSWADVIAAVKARRHVIIGVNYSDVPYTYQVQKGGRFDHAIGIDDFRSTDGYVLRYDSLDVKALWVPQSAYKAAAEALAKRVRGTTGSLFVGLTAVRPLLTSSGTGTIHYSATVVHPTSLWNDSTKRWVYKGTNQLTKIDGLIVRAARVLKGGQWCYGVSQPNQYAGYYIPTANVKLIARVTI